jgi:hypothetical protein
MSQFGEDRGLIGASSNAQPPKIDRDAIIHTDDPAAT